MEAQGQLKQNYRARYCNTERQVVDVQPGENVRKYIQDCFKTVSREHPVSRKSFSISSCSSPDLDQVHLPPPSEKRKSLSSVLINSVRSAFSATCSKAQSREACCSDSPSEDEMTFGSPALLNEEASRGPDAAPSDQDGCLFPSSNSRARPSLLPWNTAGPESENEGEFLIAESFGGPSTSWLLPRQKGRLPKKRSLTPAPLLGSDKATKDKSTDNGVGGDHAPVAEQASSCAKEPQFIVPSALQPSASVRAKKQKRSQNVLVKKKAQRQRKNAKSSAGDAGKKCSVPAVEERVESEPKELCGKQAERPPALGTGSACVSPAFAVSPEEACDRTSTQDGPCEAGEALAPVERRKSRTPSKRYSFVRAINMNDLSGPVCSQNDKASLGREIMIRGNVEDSFFEPPALEEDLALLPSNPLRSKTVRPSGTTAHLRQSKRLRLKPLEYWRGERVMYKMKPSGGLVASGIISPKQQEPRKLNRIKKPAKIDLEKVLDNTSAPLKDPSQPAHVFDAASKQEVLQECVSNGCSHLLFFDNEDVSIYKYFSTPVFSAGKLILKPLREKGSHYSYTDTMVFHVVKGRLLFTLYHQRYSLGAGSYFCVPVGNIYNIRNLLNEECILFFTQIKGNRPEGE
ncbi:centromere protein C isoform X2 [Paroedura picta]|uniref:centromere protein C isoform X2 n=1 Tax=Paroedura picta TaxID=143630 RepID=UPI004055B946